MPGASIESRLASLERQIGARKAMYRIFFADGSQRVCDALDAALTRIDAIAGICPPILSITLLRGREDSLGSELRQLIASE